MNPQLSRRELLGSAAAGVAIAMNTPEAVAKDSRESGSPFGFCMNTSTLRGHKIPLVQKLEIIARAGFTAIEPWIDELRQYEKDGGGFADLRKRLEDWQLSIESAIGFHRWIVDDEAVRTEALKDAKRDMDMLAQLGGKRLAAPPIGAHDGPKVALPQAAERYRALLEVGVSVGVVPQVELWGFSSTLSRLGDVAYVAIESGHPDACMLLDVYHLYKGGNEVSGLRQISGSHMHVMHMNDYPATPPRAEITDAARIYPGDGVAPYKEILPLLYANGFRGFLSLELFNRDVWNQDPLLVVRTGYEKMQAAVAAAMA